MTTLTKLASEKQVAFINKLLAERQHNFGDSLIVETMTSREVSGYIDTLLGLPFKTGVAPTVKVATDKQVAYIQTLISKMDNPDEYLAELLVIHGVSDLTALPLAVASKVIGNLSALRKEMPTQTNQASDTTSVSQPAVPTNPVAIPATPVVWTAPKVQVEVGAYNHKGTIYSVRRSTYNKIRAYQWNGKAWSYAGRVVYDIVPSERLTLADAMRFGAQTGTCVHCGRNLTDPESVRYGLGTVCIKKYK
jgi:hypothetical protein